MEMEYYSSMSSTRQQEMDNKSLSSITSTKQIDVNKKGRYCVARWDDWGFFIDMVRCFVWHYKCHTKIKLPLFRYFKDWQTKLLKCVVTPSTHKYFRNDDEYLCSVSLFFKEESYCLICSPPYYKKWVKVRLYNDTRLLHAVTFCSGEKICTLFQNGKLGVIEMIPEISTCLSPVTFRAPTDATAKYQKRQLVSWQDQLFLVQRKFGPPSVFEVWEADFETQQFNRIFNLEGFIIFLCGGYSVAVSSSSLEDQNCVYFTEEDDDDDYNTLYAFHIGDQSLSTTKQFCVLSPQNSVPLIARPEKKVKKQSSYSKYGKNTTGRGHNTLEPVVDSNICNQLSLDLQRKISRHLLHQDAQLYMNFRVVCKLWRSIAPPLRWKVDTTRLSSGFTQDSMWLLSVNQKDGLCTFYNPFRNLSCYMSNSDLVGGEIRYSKDGWLLISRGKSLFLLEPFSKQIIHLPERREEYFCDAMSFSVSPTNSSDWVIIGIACVNNYQVRISYLRAGDDNWTSMIMDNEGIPFLLSCSSPISFGEGFCVIGQGGDVGAFGFLEDGSPYWVIHEISGLYSPRIDHGAATRHFLVQRDQNVLYSVIVGVRGHVCVYELHFGDYNNIVRLRKQVKNSLLFISEASCLSVCGMKVSLENALLFPSFSCADDFVYYSLEAARYKLLKHSCCTNISQQKELLACCWIHTELTPDF